MPWKDTKILEFNQYRKSDYVQSIIYADLESSTKRIDGCKFNSEKFFTTKVNKHIHCRYSFIRYGHLIV